MADIIGDEFDVLLDVEELLFVAGGLGGRFKMPLGISLEFVLLPFVVVDDDDEVFKLLEGDCDDGDVLFALLPLLLLLLNVDKLCFTEMDGELFMLKLFAFDSILKRKSYYLI